MSWSNDQNFHQSFLLFTYIWGFIFFVPHEKFWFRHYRWRAANFDLFSALMAIWPLRSKGILACHTYCDTRYPFIMVISEHPWHTRVAESYHYVLNDLQWVLSRLGFEHLTFRMQGERSNQVRHRYGCNVFGLVVDYFLCIRPWFINWLVFLIPYW